MLLSTVDYVLDFFKNYLCIVDDIRMRANPSPYERFPLKNRSANFEMTPTNTPRFAVKFGQLGNDSKRVSTSVVCTSVHVRV